MEGKHRSRAALRPKSLVLAVGVAFLPWSEALWADPAANQLPTGGTVAAGSAAVTTTGSKMQIDQATDRAIINWQNFSIGRDGWVNFNQPSASSVALNRSMQPAEVFGRLSANGQVFVTSQAGVYFARSAQVDVGGLLASNLSIRDQDFLAGRYIFSNEGSSGKVVNDGQINITTVGGYAALAGTQVQNNGVIVAQAGSVALAAGDRITLDMVGDGLIKVSVDAATLNALALNAGTIQADGGRVVLSARSANALLDTVINNTGVIRARSLIERNGEIVLDGGSAGVVANNGALDASSGQGGTTGGSVKLSGQVVVLSEGSTVKASGDAGGGTVTVKASDAAYIHGDISVRDTGGNGRGGTVETSGHYVEIARAPDIGPGGTWLIDPYDIEVVDVVPPPAPGDETSRVAASLITGTLNDGANVTLDTGGLGSPGAQAGDIRVLAGIEKTAPNPASLTLRAFHDVAIDQPISMPAPGGFPSLRVEAGNDAVVNAPITTPDGGLVITAGGFTNHAAINNGVGPTLRSGMSITADRFDLAGGTINGGLGSVGLFTRTNANSIGVEAAGNTTLTNADIASITTAPDSPLTNANQLLIGTGGSMRIGDNAQVNGGSKNLVFTAGSGTPVTVGANGVTSTGDVAISGGSIAATGTIGGNHVVLRAGTGIGTPGARVTTAANTLAVNTGGSAFVTETDSVTLDNVVSAGLPVTNTVGGTLDFAANGSVAVGGIVFAGSGMNVTVGQDLNVVGTPGRSAILTTNGQQTVTASNISLQAAASGTDGRAIIANTGGTADQTINVAGGTISVTAGAVGLTNRAFISSNGNQTINGDPDIVISGGASGSGTAPLGTSNGAGINTNGAGKLQTIHARSITMTGGGGNDTFAIINGASQAITVSGDVILTGGTGSGSVARVGGIGQPAGSTNLTLSARDVLLTGGSSSGAEAGLGSTVLGAAQPNTIYISATRDVILNSGLGAGARIGTSTSVATPAGGDIGISAESIQLNGTTQPTAIRTGTVTLTGGFGGVSEGSNGYVQADSLSVLSHGHVNLVGPNQVSSFSAPPVAPVPPALPVPANITLNNSGALNVNSVFASGTLTLTNAGSLTIAASPTQDANVSSFGGQTINAESLTVTAQNGHSAQLINSGSGNQTINISGGGLGAAIDVQNLGGPGAFVFNNAPGGTQSITLSGGNHLAVNGRNGIANVSANGGAQNVSLTGGGANAVIVGSAGAFGSSFINGRGQTMTAGTGTESGSITIIGTAANNTGASIGVQTGSGAVTQNVSTTGTLAVIGGSAIGPQTTGVFQNGTGVQSVSAGNIVLQGGTSVGTSGGAAFISNTGGGGDQDIFSGGSITITAGSVGQGNRAFISTNGNQTIHGDPSIVIVGGAGGGGTAPLNTSNGAGINSAGAGKLQTINARSITMTGGGGNDAFVVINGANQMITVSEDVILTGGSGSGTPIARMGGLAGATPGPTNLTLSVRDVILTGGAGAGGEAGLGSTILGTSQANDVTVNATRDVILNEGTGAGARIGSSFIFATPAGGNINITGQSIQLNGTTQPTAIRTTGNVMLSAGMGGISEGSNGYVRAGALDVVSGGAVNLGGPNSISSFSAVGPGLAAVPGSVNLNNTSDLAVGNINAGGTLTLDVVGTLSISASGAQDAIVHSFGGQTITARAVEVSARDGRSASLWNTGPGTQSIVASNGAGVDVVVPSGGGFAQILADGGSNQSIAVVNGDHINVNGATGQGSIIAFNTAQTLSITGSGANAITLGSVGALGGSFAHGSRDQSVTAGDAGEAGSITIVGPGVNSALAGLYDNPNLGGTQTISTSGLISITGGRAPSQLSNFFTGIAHNGSGQQTITAARIALTGGQSGNGNGATIGSFGGGVSTNAGAQVIDVGSGSISVTGGTGGNANTALINALRDQTILAGDTIHVSGGTVGVGNRAGIVAGANQTIGGGADIVVTGGSSGGAAGNGNNAFINTNGGIGTQQTVNAASLNLLSGTGGIDNSASMGARKQVITVDGDVNLTGRASGGTLGGVRLGGLGGAVLTDTDLTLTLNNGGNLTLTGGSVPGNVASIGSGVGTGPLTNTINISTSGNVVLNPGVTNARIGNSASAPDSAGDISIIAGRIELNGSGATPTLVRTAGNVVLQAGPGGISEGSNGFVQAGSLNLTSFGNVDMSGPNRVATLSAMTTAAGLVFNNTGNLSLAQLSVVGGDAAITNAGDVSVSGFANSTGSLTMNVAGALKLDAQGTQDVFVTSNGQTINAQALSVTSKDGRTALLNNNSGDQTISITGGSVDIESLGVGGIAQVGSFSATGNQSITVTNGDHIKVNGGGVFSGGNQTLSITGTGDNAIRVGSAGLLNGSNIGAGRNQTVTAGVDDELGSITITGTAGVNRLAGFVTNSGIGADTQTISTTGTLRVTGGTAPAQSPNFNTGIFHNRQGLQTVTAQDIIVEGGASGSNNGAFISTNGANPSGPGGGDQVINASRSITLNGSETGTNNRAFISANRNQTINGNADIVIHAGASQVNTTTNAGIAVNTPGMLQTIHAHNIALSNAASGGVESFAGIIGSEQVINATGNVTLTGGASGGTLAGARIGSAGGAVLLPTNLTMHVDGDLVLTGGAANNGVALGSSALSSQANNITITTGGNVILNPGSGAGARIGGALADPGGGNISIAAGGNIELNGVTQRTAIRTNDNVTLSAGGHISEAANGFIAARELATTSGGAQSLVGPNQVSRFTAEAASGDVTLRNTASVLTLGTMDLPGSLGVDQTGALAVPGTVTALNQSIQATGDVLVGSATGTGPAGLFAPGAISIATPGAIVLRGSDSAFLGASVVAAGGLVAMNAGEVHLVGGAAPLAAATVMGGEVTTTVARDYTLTAGSGWGANALLFSAANITMTIGGILTIDGGHTPTNWARIQTATRDGTITLNFPNADSGSFFVDGFEGKIKHGQDGFFTGINKPAKLGDTLLVIYGL